MYARAFVIRCGIRVSRQPVYRHNGTAEVANDSVNETSDRISQVPVILVADRCSGRELAVEI